MVHIQTFVFNPLQENTYVIYDDTADCVIVDPGCYDEQERNELASFIFAQKLNVKMLLNTHCHIDHILGNEFVKQKYDTKLHMHATEEFVLNAQKLLAPHYGFHQYQESKPDVFLKEGDTINFGNQSLSVLFVPGHSPGHLAFYSAKEKFVLAGDVLFENSVGRTDLPGGNHKMLISSIREKLFNLPNDVTVYPGHGGSTTIGVEKKTNPFCAITVG